MKGTVFTVRVKHMRDRFKEFVNEELRDKEESCLYDRTDVGTSFVGRLFRK